MQTRRNRLTFVVMAILVGAIVSITTSDVFAQTQNNNDPYNGSIIDRILAQQGSNNSGNNKPDEENCIEENEDEEDVEEAEDEDKEDDEECDVEEEDGADNRGGNDENEKLFTTLFMAENCTFASTVTNPFFILEPGYQQVFRGK